METEFVKSIEIAKEKASSIQGIISPWWKDISKQSASKASPGKMYAIGNYLLELVKNSLSDGKSDGKVTAYFDEERIKIEIEAFSSEQRELNMNVGGSYGTKEAIEYADDFIVEASGKRYEKANVREMLEEYGETDLRNGSKVTFIKFIVAPPIEEEENDNSFAGRRWN
jgi:hypothetical protein